MKHDHAEEIREILNSSDTPLYDINYLVEREIAKNDKWWGYASIIVCLITLFACWGVQPSKKDILKAARPVCDSVKVAFQKRMDFVVDSLSKEQNQPFK